jgi:hypothetical protein
MIRVHAAHTRLDMPREFIVTASVPHLLKNKNKYRTESIEAHWERLALEHATHLDRLEDIVGFEPCEPVAPVAPYLGGKKLLAKKLVPLLRTIPHRAYVEPFVGMGGVFFRRNFVSSCEVINDLNGDVANLFRVLKWHYVPLMDILRWQITSRAALTFTN